MAVIAAPANTLEAPDRRAWGEALARVARYVPMLAVMALTIGIHVPTLDAYFFGDDFLVLGDVNSQSFPAYMGDVVLLRDLTPNWRPLTMAVYYGEHALFGLDPMPWRIVNLAAHAATVAMLYVTVLSITKRVFVATAAALIFGVSSSAVHTVTYITAFPHVLSELLLVSSLYALHRYVEGEERRPAWYWCSFALYVLGFLANEGGVVIGVVLFAYYFFFSFMRRGDPLELAVKMAPFALAAIALVGGFAGCGCQGVDNGFYGVGWHIPQATWIYMSRMAYPVGQIRIDPTALEWAVGSVVAAAAIFFVVRGPNIARVAAIATIAALMPYAPGKIWTATRYTYMALPFFAILVGVGAGFVYHHARRVNVAAANVLAVAALATAGGLLAWQTIDQTDPFLDETERWEVLTTGLREQYADIPPGTTVFVVDDEGIWSNAFWQATWMPSVGRALWGEDRAVHALPAEFIGPVTRNLDPTMYLVVEYRDGEFRKSSAASVAP